MSGNRVCRECGTRHKADERLCAKGHVLFSDPPDDILVGRVLDQRYEIAQPIGRGGFGAVYLGCQVRLKGRPCAIKVARPEISQDPLFATRFEREKKALSALQNRNTVQILDYGRTSDGIDYIVMEYIEGLALDKALALQGRFSPARAMGVAVGVCHALEEAHGLGILHRDLKPSNVMLVQTSGIELPKVIDFGLTRIAADSERQMETRTGEMPCTPAYAGYEQIMGHTHKVDHRSDIYSLAAMVYELLAGVPPYGDRVVRSRYDSATYYFMALGYAKANEDPTPLGKLVHLQDSAMVMLANQLERMLARKVENRPGSVLEVRRRFEELLALMDPATARRPLELLEGEGSLESSEGVNALAPTQAPELAATLDSEQVAEGMQKKAGPGFAAGGAGMAGGAGGAGGGVSTAPLRTLKEGVVAPAPEKTIHQGLAQPRFGLLRRPMALAVAALSIAAIATTVTIGTGLFEPQSQGDLAVGPVASKVESKRSEDSAPMAARAPEATKSDENRVAMKGAKSNGKRRPTPSIVKPGTGKMSDIAKAEEKSDGKPGAEGGEAKAAESGAPAVAAAAPPRENRPAEPTGMVLAMNQPSPGPAEPAPPLEEGNPALDTGSAQTDQTASQLASLAQGIWSALGAAASSPSSPAAPASPPGDGGFMVAVLDPEMKPGQKSGQGAGDGWMGDNTGGMKSLGNQGGYGMKGEDDEPKLKSGDTKGLDTQKIAGDKSTGGTGGGEKSTGETGTGEKGGDPETEALPKELTKAAMQPVLEKAKIKLNQCLASHGNGLTTLQVRVTLVIQPAGTIHMVLLTPTGSGGAMDGCLRSVFTSLVFPPIQAEVPSTKSIAIKLSL